MGPKEAICGYFSIYANGPILVNRQNIFETRWTKAKPSAAVAACANWPILVHRQHFLKTNGPKRRYRQQPQHMLMGPIDSESHENNGPKRNY
jgi:hypothetical protein